LCIDEFPGASGPSELLRLKSSRRIAGQATRTEPQITCGATKGLDWETKLKSALTWAAQQLVRDHLLTVRILARRRQLAVSKNAVQIPGLPGLAPSCPSGAVLPQEERLDGFEVTLGEVTPVNAPGGLVRAQRNEVDADRVDQDCWAPQAAGVVRDLNEVLAVLPESVRGLAYP
jgi:hypothetical protein